MNKIFSSERLRILLLGLIGFLAYINTAGNGYSLDDEFILDKAFLEEGFSAIPACFKEKYATNGTQSYEYRPVVFVSFAIQAQFFGLSPKWGHIVNAFLYALTGIVLYLLCLRMFRQFHWILPLLTVLIFLIHPIHTEVVASLKNRDEILSFLLSILSLFTCFKLIDSERKGRMILYGIMAISTLMLALLAKKSCIVFIAIIPLSLYFFGDINRSKRFMSIGGLLLGLLVLRFVLHFMSGGGGDESVRSPKFFENPWYVDMPGFIDRIPMAFYSIMYYLKLLLMPYPLRFYYGYDQVPMADWSHPMVWMGIIVVGAALYFCFKQFKAKKVWVFGLLYFLISVSMFTNFLKPVPGIIGERFIYGAVFGMAIAAAWAILKLLKIPIENKAYSIKWKAFNVNQKIVTIGAVFIFAVCAGYIFNRNGDWDNKETLYAADMPHLSNSAKANSLYGASGQQKAVKLAKTLAEQVNQIRQFQASINQYQKQNNQRGVQQVLAEARKVDAQRKVTFNAWGVSLRRAIKYYAIAIGVYPDYRVAHNNLGSSKTMYLNYLQGVIEIERQVPSPDQTLIFKTQDTIKMYKEEASKHFKSAISIDSNYAEAWRNYGNVCELNLDLAEAERAYTASFDIEPGQEKTFNSLFKLYQKGLKTAQGKNQDVAGLNKRFKAFCIKASEQEVYTSNLDLWLSLTDLYAKSGEVVHSLRASEHILPYLEKTLVDLRNRAKSAGAQKSKFDLQISRLDAQIKAYSLSLSAHYMQNGDTDKAEYYKKKVQN